MWGAGVVKSRQLRPSYAGIIAFLGEPPEKSGVMDLALGIKRTPAHFEAVETYFRRGIKAAATHGVPFAAGLAVPIVGGLAGAGAALLLRSAPSSLWTPMAWSGLWGACVAVLLMLLLKPGDKTKSTKANLARDQFLSGRQIFLGDRGVIEAGEGWQTLTYWSALSALTTLTDGYLLERGDENGIFVPYTAFQNETVKGKFLIYVDQRMSGKAKPPSIRSLPPPPPDAGPIHL